MKNLYCLVVKLESKFSLIQDYFNRALNNWAQVNKLEAANNDKKYA